MNKVVYDFTGGYSEVMIWGFKFRVFGVRVEFGLWKPYEKGNDEIPSSTK